MPFHVLFMLISPFHVAAVSFLLDDKRLGRHSRAGLELRCVHTIMRRVGKKKVRN